MSSKSKKQPADEKAQEFIRKTVTVPSEIAPFADEQAAKPEHAGNFSSYVRSLIIADRAKHQKQAA